MSFGMKENQNYLKYFGRKCFFWNNKRRSSKFLVPKLTIFSRYFTTVNHIEFNKSTLVIEESMHVVFDKSNTLLKNNEQEHNIEIEISLNEEKEEMETKLEEPIKIPKETSVIKSQLKNRILGDLSKLPTPLFVMHVQI